MINIPKDDLRRLYIDKGEPLTKISKIYKCTAETIKKRLKEYNIPIRLNGLFPTDDDETLMSKTKFKIGIGTGLSINENKE